MSSRLNLELSSVTSSWSLSLSLSICWYVWLLALWGWLSSSCVAGPALLSLSLLLRMRLFRLAWTFFSATTSPSSSAWLTSASLSDSLKACVSRGRLKISSPTLMSRFAP